MIVQSIFFAILINFGLSKYFIIGPAQFHLDKIEDCPEYKNLLIKSSFRLHMYNKSTQLLDVNVILPLDFGENISVSLKAAKVNKNKVNPNAFTIEEDNACETMKRYGGTLFDNVLDKMGEPRKCPIAKGNYSVSNLFIDLDQMKVKMFLEGNFYTRLIFKQQKKIHFCKDFYLTLTPKIQ